MSPKANQLRFGRAPVAKGEQLVPPNNRRDQRRLSLRTLRGRLGRLQRREREPVTRNVPNPLEDADDPVPQVTENVAADDHRAQDRRPSSSPPSVNRTITTFSSAIATPFVRTALTTAPRRASLPNQCQAGPCRCHSGRSHEGCGLLACFADRVEGMQQSDVREGLRKVAQHAFAVGVVLLAEEADIVSQRRELL
jgi:hypothetical protein